jgi:hypothetical protein
MMKKKKSGTLKIDELYGYCVGVIGIDPGYFLDEMSQDELSAICSGRNDFERIRWEQTRTICFYSIVAQNGTVKFQKPQDLFSLPWDKNRAGIKKSKRLTKEELMEKVSMIRTKKIS